MSDAKRGRLLRTYFVRCATPDCMHTFTYEGTRGAAAEVCRAVRWGRRTGKWYCAKCMRHYEESLGVSDGATPDKSRRTGSERPN